MARVLDAREVWHVVQREGPGDRAATAIASRQLAVITCRQLQLAGVSRGAIVGRCERGLAHRVHRGVYLWGAATPLPGALELGACLACGPGALVSHASAAALWGLAAALPEQVEVIVAGHHCRGRPGLRVHRVSTLTDIADVRGIPVTSPARTLVDFAAEHDGDLLERAVSEAFARPLVSDRELRTHLTRGRAGAARVRSLLDALQGPRITRSCAERLLLRLCRDAGLPPPRTNVRVQGALVDAYWPEHNLIVEMDGFGVHGHRAAFENDRRRDQILVAAGYRVMRVTWLQLTATPLAVAARVAAALARQ